MLRKLFAAALIAALLCAIALPAAAAYGSFTDVKDTDYFASAVTWAVSHGVTYGKTETSFAPDDTCTRAQVMTFLWRVKGEPMPQARRNPFLDVPLDSYFENAVLWAVEQGITVGTSQTSFSPDDTCTNAQIITFLWRANNAPEPVGASLLTQGWSADEYYYKAVAWGDGEALFEDMGTVFDPDEPCSRARTIAWLYRDAVVHVSDITGLISAIRPGRVIFLSPGTYNLTEWANAAARQHEVTGNDYVRLERCNDGWEVQLQGVKNLDVLRSESSQGKVEIVTEPRYANVLSFRNCSGIYLSGLTMGHTPERGTCSGAVLDFRDCGAVAMSDMDLYGCGTYGITAADTDSIQTVDSTIRDCSYGLLTLDNVTDAGFGGCEFRNCDGYTMVQLYRSAVYFSECLFHNLKWSEGSRFVSLEPGDEASFTDCRFDWNVLNALSTHPSNGSGVTLSNPSLGAG